jgi:parvulin-like peptidyl-prolyl isomerase
VTFLAPRFLVFPLALLLLAGCGTQASSSATSTSTSSPTSAPATAGPASPGTTQPTAVVSGGSTAAVVNGHSIPMETYRLVLRLDQLQYAGQPGATVKVAARQAMDQIIVDEIVREYATVHHITVSPSDVNKEIQAETAHAGGQAKYQQELKQAGLTLDQYKKLLQPNMLTRKVANALFPIQMKQVQAAHVWHILISLHPQNKRARTDKQAKALATNILHQVQQGADFAGLARQYSDDPGSAQQGGDLGNVTQGQTVPPFDKAVFSLPLHHPALVHSQYGYHVVEVLSRGTTQQPSQTAQQQQQQKFGQWAQQQMKKAKIKRIAKVK